MSDYTLLIGNTLENFAKNPGRNKRNWWLVNSEPYPGSHYATFPTALVTPCILAGSSAHGVCEKCGNPWQRQVERTSGAEGHTHKLQDLAKTGKSTNGTGKSTLGIGGGGNGQAWAEHGSKSTTLGWSPTCTCGADVVPATILDCFVGSGTVISVALKHGRRATGIDLDPRNMELVRKRVEECQPLLFSL